MRSVVTYTTTADAGANPLRMVCIYILESQRLLTIHKRNILSRPVRLTLETCVDVCARMITVLDHLDTAARKKGGC